MTRSTGTSGLILFGSPPSLSIASRIAARSTTAGTPVKSWSNTRAGLNGISSDLVELVSQSRMRSISVFLTLNSSQLRTADSSNTLIDYGSLLTLESFKDFKHY